MKKPIKASQVKKIAKAAAKKAVKRHDRDPMAHKGMR